MTVPFAQHNGVWLSGPHAIIPYGPMQTYTFGIRTVTARPTGRIWNAEVYVCPNTMIYERHMAAWGKKIYPTQLFAAETISMWDVLAYACTHQIVPALAIVEGYEEQQVYDTAVIIVTSLHDPECFHNAMTVCDVEGYPLWQRLASIP